MRNYSANPVEMISSFWRNKRLTMQLSKRDLLGRYRGSTLGLSWSFFTTILMLVIYTFVFSVVFKARWGVSADESKTDFAIILFVGLCVMFTRKVYEKVGPLNEASGRGFFEDDDYCRRVEQPGLRIVCVRKMCLFTITCLRPSISLKAPIVRLCSSRTQH